MTSLPGTRFSLSTLIAIGLCVTTSCMEQMVPQAAPKASRVPFTSMASLEVDLKLNSGLTLVECAQDFSCARCDQMASTMQDLRSGFSDDVNFQRVSYSSAGSRFQLGVCPTYLFVLDGQVVDQLSGKQPYPVMASRLNDLLAVHARNADDHSETSGRQNGNEIDGNYN